MKKLHIALLAAAICLPAAAQDLNSAYFLDGYKYRHRLNPALAPSRSYFSLPVLGGITAGTRSDLGMNTLLYPRDGQLTTFMNSSVSADEFLSKLKADNDIGVGLKTNIISVGSWGKNGFTSVELNLRADVHANLPYDLFDFMKNLGARQSYNISNLDVSGRAYAELALGHSHSISENLNIGAKVKVLVGLANVNAHVDNMDVVMNGDKWSITAQGSLNSSVPGLVIPTKGETGASTDPAAANQLDFAGMEFSTDRLMSDLSSLSYGAAIDLGAEYKFDGLLEGLNVSAAVLDLGFISWGTNHLQATTSQNSWEFGGFDDISFEEGSENSIESQFGSIGEGLADMVVFEKSAAASKAGARMLACTVNLGAEYELPFYRKLSVGFLYTSRIDGLYSMHEGRFSANVAPTKWFGFSASYGISNYGSSLGAVLNIDLPGIGLYVGTDSAILNVTPPVEALDGIGLPCGKLNLDVYVGLVFNLGRYRSLGDNR